MDSNVYSLLNNYILTSKFLELSMLTEWINSSNEESHAFTGTISVHHYNSA